MTEWDTSIKPEPIRQLCITLDGQYRTAFLVVDGKIVSQGFTCDAKRMGTLQVDFLVDSLLRLETRKE